MAESRADPQPLNPSSPVETHSVRQSFGMKWNEIGEPMVCKLLKMWWPGTESNRRRQPFQGCALPTELPGREQDFILSDR